MRATILPTSLFALLLSSIPTSLCDVVFTSPAPGAAVAGGTSFAVSWKESGVAPLITDFLSYELLLFSGGNAAPFQLYGLTTAPGSFATGNTATVNVPVGVGGTGTNA